MFITLRNVNILSYYSTYLRKILLYEKDLCIWLFCAKKLVCEEIKQKWRTECQLVSFLRKPGKLIWRNFGKNAGLVQCAKCENLRFFFLLFRFYAKSKLAKLDVLKQTKTAISCHFWGSEFCWFGNFQPSKSTRFHKTSKFRASKCV